MFRWTFYKLLQRKVYSWKHSQISSWNNGAMFWKMKGTYKYIDSMICCSEFMKTKMDSNPLFASKTIALHNFIDKVEWKEAEKKDYVLYFGRFSEEKGIGTLIEVC